MKNLKGLLLAVLVLFAMSSCVQEEECENAGEVVGLISDGTTYTVQYVNHDTELGGNDEVDQVIFENLEVGQEICLNEL